MFERFTDAARRTIFFALEEARESGSRYIETHHLLLALLREQADLFRPWLDAGAVEEIRTDYVRRFPPQGTAPTPGDLPLSHESRRVLAYAAEKSRNLKQTYIGRVHLALGLLREEHSEAATTLRRQGVDPAELRQRLIGFTGPLSRKDLSVLVQQIPPARAGAAVRILEALQWEVVTISVASPSGSFEVSFGEPHA